MHLLGVAMFGASLLCILVFVLGGAAALVVLLVARKRGGAGVTEPSCAACGYNVRGLSQLTCPECGADLREVGIVTPQSSRPIGPGVAILLWSLILPLPALMISGVAMELLAPRVRHADRSMSFYRGGGTGAQMEERLFQSMQLRASGKKVVWGRGYNVPVPVQQLVIELTPNSDGAADLVMTIDTATDTISYPGPNGTVRVDGPIDAPVVRDWMKASSIDPDHADAQAVADDLVAMVKSVPIGDVDKMQNLTSKQFQGGGGGASSATRMMAWPPIVLLLFWAAVWAGVSYWLYRKLRIARPGG